MAEESDSGDKTEEPSQYRLEESRKKGDVASSQELSSVLVLAGTLLALALSVVFILEEMQNYIHWLYGLSFKEVFQPDVGKKVFYQTIKVGAKCIAPCFLTAFCIGFFAKVSQVGFIFAPDVLNLKLDRVNPLNGIKKIFSMKSIFTAVKGVFKFAVIIGISYLVLRSEFPKFIGFFHSTSLDSILHAKVIFSKLAFSILGGLAVIAAIDFIWEKFQHTKKLRQTKRELKDELKEKEGNPEIRQKIKSIQREMAQKRMMAEIPEADVIVTNPTHLSVAIKYDSKNMVSPKVVAMGADHMAMRIRQIAKKHDIPMVEDVPLARALYKTVKVGEMVPRNLYKAVAEVLAFVYRLNRKRKALNRGVN